MYNWAVVNQNIVSALALGVLLVGCNQSTVVSTPNPGTVFIEGSLQGEALSRVPIDLAVVRERYSLPITVEAVWPAGVSGEVSLQNDRLKGYLQSSEGGEKTIQWRISGERLSVSRSTSLKLSLRQDFSLSAQQNGPNVEVSITRQNLSDEVRLRLEGLPAGLRANEVKSTGNSATIALSGQAKPGVYQVWLKGKAANMERQSQLSLRFEQEETNFAILGGAGSTNAGFKAVVLVRVLPIYGSPKAKVNLSCEALQGFACSMASTSVYPSEQPLELIVAVDKEVRPGRYSFKLKGQSGSVQREGLVDITVN